MKARMLVAVLACLSVAGVVFADYSTHPYNYNFGLNSATSTVEFHVWMRDGSATGSLLDEDQGTVFGSGNVSAKIWQTGPQFGQFNQIEITDLYMQAMGNPSINMSWGFLGMYSVTATANNVSVEDDADNPNNPGDRTGPVNPADSKFTLTHYDANAFGTVNYTAKVIGIPYSSTVNIADYNPQNGTVDGMIVKSGNTIKIVADQTIDNSISVKSINSSLPNWYMVYSIKAHLETNALPLLAPLVGDASFDGNVDVSDLGILAANYGSSNKNWGTGDFNFDGNVDVSDLGILAAHYGTSGGAVPEPLTLSLLVFGGIGLLRKRG